MKDVQSLMDGNLSVISNMSQKFWELTRTNLDNMARMNARQGEMMQDWLTKSNAWQAQFSKIAEHMTSQGRDNYSKVETAMKDIMATNMENIEKMGLPNYLKMASVMKKS